MAKTKKSVKNSTAVSSSKASPDSTPEKAAPPKAKKEILTEDHLPPLPLVFTVLFCSGLLFVVGLRDFMATGKVFLGGMDAAFLEFTKSTQWFNDSKGWKSSQGGLSAIQQFTTDENNMGGFFVRKNLGAAALTFSLHKLLPLLFHPSGAQWKRGHFRPLLATSVFANMAVASLYMYYLDDFTVAGADMMPKCLMAVLAFESVVMLFYLVRQRTTTRGPAIAMHSGKTEKSVVSRIVARTVCIVSGVMGLIMARDLLAPGTIIPYFPRDDIYMEWTGVFLHSPPAGSVEAAEHGIDAPFYIGEKFVAQALAVHVLVLILYKVVSSCLISLGSDGSGQIKARMFWKVSAIGGFLMVAIFRLFAAAALSASLDVRWHLMSIAYEAFILALMGYT